MHATSALDACASAVPFNGMTSRISIKAPLSSHNYFECYPEHHRARGAVYTSFTGRTGPMAHSAASRALRATARTGLSALGRFAAECDPGSDGQGQSARTVEARGWRAGESEAVLASEVNGELLEPLRVEDEWQQTSSEN